MPRGNKPKPSTDINEERMFTWRYKGSLHNTLIQVVTQKGMSLNRYVTKAILAQLDRDNESLNKK
jgi:predicted HicB family RNase H-like nuclease